MSIINQVIDQSPETDEWVLEPLLRLFVDDWVNIDSTILKRASARIKAYKLNTWLCTDTDVGHIAFTFDGFIIATSLQTCRKCDTNWTFIRNDRYSVIGEFVLSLAGVEIPAYIGFDEDLAIGEVYNHE